jgi:hypothetical protein
MGASPEKLAWSLAVGVVVGVNPLLGSTTLLALGLAGIFRLNVVASQVGNHAMYPVEIALFPVFIKLGSMLFVTEKLPLAGKELWEAVRRHPWNTTKVLWRWEWHALDSGCGRCWQRCSAGCNGANSRRIRQSYLGPEYSGTGSALWTHAE